MNRIFIILLFVFLTVPELSGQTFYEFPTGFSLIFGFPEKTNPYYFGGNPALLNFRRSDEVLSIRTDLDDDRGQFRQFIEPENNRFYQLRASGKKSIDSTQKFRGSFAFQRLERRNWNWIFTKDYDSGNPFLIGDSTTGNTRINGIAMDAEYAIQITNSISAGISLEYAVDEALKQISPRPTSEHRDIDVKFGMNYSFTSGLNTGLVFYVTDKNEHIAYREDEGSLTNETIILKFKGYDFPNVFRKKTETRYSYTNMYKTGLTFSYCPENIFNAAGFLHIGFEKNNIKDDAINPEAVGFWKNDLIDAGVRISTKLSDTRIDFQYLFHSENGWAKNPAFDVLYYEREFSENSFTAALQQTLSNSLSIGIEGGISFTPITENDHYSDVFSYTKFNCIHFTLGSEFALNQNISALFGYSYFVKNLNEGQRLSGMASGYFINYRQYDLLYQQSEFSNHKFSVAMQIDEIFDGSLLVYLNYGIATADADSYFSGKKRNSFDSALEYRIKVF
ncbi:MAG: hypothetical protein K9I69_00820 [Ignavibacteriales bacterium]|nr:hypothetical protein [Ignavibacteriales bacterium]MCF8306959.1 hypothetical protein [Ignavibacteriales bacterium]MCF8437399.1 hypothetical protein [Ignavibacteriales bacterium]